MTRSDSKRCHLIATVLLACTGFAAAAAPSVARADSPASTELRLMSQAGAGALGFAIPTTICGLILDPSDDDFETTGVWLYACGLLSAGATTMATYFTGLAMGGDAEPGYTLLGTAAGVVVGGMIALPLGLLDIITGLKQDTLLTVVTVGILGLFTVGGSVLAYELSNEIR
jgi:hypothetical protein